MIRTWPAMSTFRTRRLRWAAFLLFGVVGVSHPGRADVGSVATTGAVAAAPAEFWTIEANEGLSAGGHSAIRIGETVHHLEHRGDGLIQARQEARAPFDLAYRGRGNRGIDVVPLDLSPAETARLKKALEERVLRQRIRFDSLERAEEDEAWLRRAAESGVATVRVPGLGLVSQDSQRCASSHPKDRSRRKAVRKSLTEERLNEHTTLAAFLSQANASHPGGFRRWLEAVQLRSALETLAGCAMISSSVLRSAKTAESLGPSGRAHWQSIGAQLERDLTRLTKSERTDRGLALLLTWGRIAAVRQTLERNQIIVLDAFVEGDDLGASLPEIDRLPIGWIEGRLKEAHMRYSDAKGFVDRWKPAFGPIERVLDRLERARHDLDHAQSGTPHIAPRPRGALTVSRSLERPARKVVVSWPESITMSELRLRANAAQRTREAARRALPDSHRYDLFRRNCVTELLATVEQALGDSGARRLPRLLSFVPAVTAGLIDRRYSAGDRNKLPSVRELALERAAAGRGILARWTLAARESNTLTSRLYRPHAGDSTFIWFTSNLAWLRPPAGVANLTVATLSGFAGLLSWPLDDGTRLTRSLRGAAMSLPEIFFVNIRKGTFPVSPPREHLEEPGSDPPFQD